MKISRFWPLALALLLASPTLAKDRAEYPAPGKHIVLISGDEEYRSEESLPMLAKILAQRHGFHCTVLFAINPADGTINPNIRTNIPGMEALDTADLCIMALRFRELPDAQMKHFVSYLYRGKPIIALRTSTHAFAYDQNKTSPYAIFDWRSTNWPGGFGQQILGETWVAHHGAHGKESTRGVTSTPLTELTEHRIPRHPILRDVTDIWVPTDVYAVTHLPADAEVVVWGQVLTGMKPDDPPLDGPKNHPMMPVAWVRPFRNEWSGTSKVFTTTMGAAVDLENESLRRLLVNACYWALGREVTLEASVTTSDWAFGQEVPPKADVSYVGEYEPTWFGFGKFKPGVKPEDLELKR